MIPIRDENKSLTSPHITRILIIINVIVFLVALLPDLSKPYLLEELLGVLPPPVVLSSSLYKASLNYGMIPAEVLQGRRLYTLFTSMFLHADLVHLGGNMLFLYVFGDNVEDAFGHFRFVSLYILAGIVGSLAHTGSLFYFGGGQAVPTIGASGAISGVLGAYLLLYPKAKILTLVFFGWIWLIALPALVFLGVWFAYQFLYGYFASGGGVAYWAHVGGFVAGMFFGAVWRGRRRKRVLW